MGGKSAKNVKRTRVRSRAMSTALRRIFDETGDVFIMGHKFPDMDALGSAFFWLKRARQLTPKAEKSLHRYQRERDHSRCRTVS